MNQVKDPDYISTKKRLSKIKKDYKIYNKKDKFKEYNEIVITPPPVYNNNDIVPFKFYLKATPPSTPLQIKSSVVIIINIEKDNGKFFLKVSNLVSALVVLAYKFK